MQVAVNGIIAGAVYGLVALAVGIVRGPTGEFRFTDAALIASGGYACATVATGLPGSVWVGVLGGGLAAAALGLVCEVLVYAPLRRRIRTSTGVLLASLGMYIVLQNCLSVAFGDAPKTVALRSARAVIQTGGARITDLQLWTILVAAMCSSIVFVLLRTKPVGAFYRATVADADLAGELGLPVTAVRSGAVLCGSVIAGLAGAMIALDLAVTPTMGLGYFMYGIVGVILGQDRGPFGALAGGLALGVLLHLGTWKLGSEWQDAIAFVVLLVLLLAGYGKLRR